jgi:Rad3-related DNA helicase
VNNPTGSGKSLTAAAAARLVEEDGGKTSILVHRKFLQQQYLSLNHPNGSPILLATGRANWPCILDGYQDRMADTAPCTDGFKCDHKRHGDCPYYRQRDLADLNPIRVLNYPLFLENARIGGKLLDSDEDESDSRFNFFRGNRLIICDEGHKVDKEILNVVSTTISTRDTQLVFSVGLKMPKLLPGRISLKHNPQVGDWARQARTAFGAELYRLAEDPTYRTGEKKERREAIKKLLRKLDKIIEIEKFAAVVQYEESGALKFRPVLSEQWAHPLLLQHAQKTVLMSATIFGADYWASRMGVEPDDVEYIEIPSMFPAANRPIFFSPVARVNYQIWQDENEMNNLISNIDRIIAGYLPAKGVIHTANRRLAQAIQARSKFKQVMFVGGAEVIDAFKAAPVGVLVSYSATEGVDLPDDLCRFVIFAKVPWLPKEDPVIQLQMEEIPGFYEYEAASEIVQGVGRGMRHESDWCVSYILDASFRMLKSRTWKMLPTWFTEALQEVPVPPLPAAASHA